MSKSIFYILMSEVIDENRQSYHIKYLWLAWMDI